MDLKPLSTARCNTRMEEEEEEGRGGGGDVRDFNVLSNLRGSSQEDKKKKKHFQKSTHVHVFSCLKPHLAHINKLTVLAHTTKEILH